MKKTANVPIGGDWKRETWHRETIEIVEADIARPDKTAAYRMGGHRETCFIVRLEAQYKLIFATGSIIWAAHRVFYLIMFNYSYVASYSYVQQTKWAVCVSSVWAHY